MSRITLNLTQLNLVLILGVYSVCAGQVLGPMNVQYKPETSPALNPKPVKEEKSKVLPSSTFQLFGVYCRLGSLYFESVCVTKIIKATGQLAVQLPW